MFAWRRAARLDMGSVSTADTGSSVQGFVPIVADGTVPAAVSRQASAVAVIEVKLAGAVVRVVSGIDDTAQLTTVLRAVRASASRT
jgi:hypothetical protein